MRRKLVWMLLVAAALGLVLTGCGQQRTQASYIGADAAKAIALDAAGIAEGRRPPLRLRTWRTGMVQITIR